MTEEAKPVESYIFCSNTFCNRVILTVPGYTKEEFIKKCVNDNGAWFICKKCKNDWLKPALEAGGIALHYVKNYEIPP